MENFFKQIRYSSYDILGLFIPGGLFLMIFGHIFELDIFNYLININTADKFKLIFKLSQLSISLYLIGNILKIISQIFYDLFSSIFDEMIMKWISLLYNYIFSSKKKFPILVFLKNFSKNIFYFKANKYFSVNEFMINEIVENINKKKNIKLKNNWDSIYKIGKMYEENKPIKSLSSVFLAKYTLYRSLSFIFFINFLLVLLKDNYLIETIYQKIPNFLFIIISFFSWLAFHIKYKRYYTYCGNETLVALYYRLILEEEEK